MEGMQGESRYIDRNAVKTGVVPDDVAFGQTGAGQEDAVLAVAADKILVNGVSRRCLINHNAVSCVGQRRRAGQVGADLVALDEVAGGLRAVEGNPVIAAAA